MLTVLELVFKVMEAICHHCEYKGADVFKMAIAVAPVTNWRYYDNIYTERYMRTPQENASGYDINTINHVDSVKGNIC